MFLCDDIIMSGSVSFMFYTQLAVNWGRTTHICIIKQPIIGSDNGMSPGWCQAIIWTNDGLLLNGPLGANFIEIWIKINTFSFKKMHLGVSSGKWQPFCLGLNALNSASIDWWHRSIFILIFVFHCCSILPVSFKVTSLALEQACAQGPANQPWKILAKTTCNQPAGGFLLCFCQYFSG